MMRRVIGSLFATGRQSLSRSRAARCGVRPQLEQLGERALPNASALQHLVRNCRGILAEAVGVPVCLGEPRTVNVGEVKRREPAAKCPCIAERGHLQGR